MTDNTAEWYIDIIKLEMILGRGLEDQELIEIHHIEKYYGDDRYRLAEQIVECLWLDYILVEEVLSTIK